MIIAPIAEIVQVRFFSDNLFNCQPEHSMASAKETMSEIIARQPDDSSYDEILRELAFARMVERGLEDSDAGRTIADDDVKRKGDSWQ